MSNDISPPEIPNEPPTNPPVKAPTVAPTAVGSRYPFSASLVRYTLLFTVLIMLTPDVS